jgi:hypothetical protein
MLRRLLIGLSLFLLILAAGVGCYIFMVRLEIRHFDQFTGESKILGKNPEQVIAMCGTPWFNYAEHPDPNHSQAIVYKGPYGDRCYIGFTNGVATKVLHYGK